MKTEIKMIIAGDTADMLSELAEQKSWSIDNVLAWLLDDVAKAAERGLAVHPDATLAEVPTKDLTTRVERFFEAGDMVNCEFAEDEAWLLGMVLNVDPKLGIEVQLTSSSAKLWSGAARDIWSPEALHIVK